MKRSILKNQELTQTVAEIFKKHDHSINSLNLSRDILLFKYTRPCDLDVALYEPVLCLVLQGKKEMALGGRRLAAGAGESLIVSHAVPIVSKIAEASAGRPYFALVLNLDLNIIRGLYHDFGELAVTTGGAHALELDKTSPRLLDSLCRLLNAVLDPADSIVLLPHILREVHYRILQSNHGGMLRSLLRYDSHENGIARAISIIRGSFKEALSVPDLAKQVGMSTSSFYQHFKVVTESTPLQYQKDLRLIEAQRLLTAEGLSVTSTAYEIGYESPSQFSREYVRKFGSTPSADSRQNIHDLNLRRS